MAPSSPEAPRKFTFDTVFDGSKPPATNVYKRLFTTDEAEALAAKARTEGEAAAMQSVEAQTARLHATIRRPGNSKALPRKSAHQVFLHQRAPIAVWRSRPWLS